MSLDCTSKIDSIVEEPEMTQLSVLGYCRMFDAFRDSGRTNEESFDLVFRYCDLKGFKHRYTCYESFQRQYYKAKKNRVA